MKNLLIMAVLAFATIFGVNAQEQAKYTPKKTDFTVMTLKNAETVKLRIYENGTGGDPLETIKMKRGKSLADGAVNWTATVKGDLKGK
ncbi:MAG: hypothetical protein IK092_04070, partial [Muribaculaceae bacterium]|nr:hypothetical protein [Muribaculaceae bacterium]